MTTITLAGYDNDVGQLEAYTGRVREAVLPLALRTQIEGRRQARQENHGPPSAQVQTTPQQAQPSSFCCQSRNKQAKRSHGAENRFEPNAAKFVRPGRWRRRTRRERFDKAISIALLEFVKFLDEDQAYRLCNGGSIWIYKDDLMCGDVDEDSYEVLGCTSDPGVTAYGEGIGAYCLIDCDWTRGLFVFDHGIDCDDDEIATESQAVAYSKESGLRAVVIGIESSLDVKLKRLWLQGLWLSDLGD